MPLHKIKDFDPDYRNHFDDKDVQGFDLYTGNEKVGSVDDILVDDNGNFRYLAINTGVWILGKKVLVPIGRARIDYSGHRAYVDGLTKEQVQSLPDYKETTTVDANYEEQVRGVYRPLATAPGAATASAVNAYNPDSYSYSQEPALYGLNDQDHQNFKLYEERLIANKIRQKTGEVAVGKRIETEQARVSVPLEKERVVIERVTPTDAGRTVTPGTADFQEGEVARVEVYEETADIRKEAFVREEVNIKKVVDRDVTNVEEQLRREELDVTTDGNPTLRRPDQRPDELV